MADEEKNEQNAAADSSGADGVDVEAHTPPSDEQGADATDGDSASPADTDTPADAEGDAGDAPEADEPEAEATDPAPEDEPAPAAPGSGAEEAAVGAGDDDDLAWKDKKRLEKSREPHQARAQQAPEDRAKERDEKRKRNAAERRRYRAKQKAKHVRGTGTPPAEHDSVAAKERQGTVVSAKPDKTITVRIDVSRRHPVYHKIVRRSGTLHAHDERNEAAEGDIVRIVETRPMSRTKRWRLVEIVKRAPVEEVVPG